MKTLRLEDYTPYTPPHDICVMKQPIENYEVGDLVEVLNHEVSAIDDGPFLDRYTITRGEMGFKRACGCLSRCPVIQSIRVTEDYLLKIGTL